MSVKARVSVDGGLNFFEVEGQTRIVVKLRTSESDTQEVSMYIEDDGRIDCRYFKGVDSGKPIFDGMMYTSDFVLGCANTPGTFNA